jgi:hypothetical protein
MNTLIHGYSASKHIVKRVLSLVLSKCDIEDRYEVARLLGFIKIHVLHHAAQEPIYGVATIAELAVTATIFPLARSLRCCTAWKSRAT